MKKINFINKVFLAGIVVLFAACEDSDKTIDQIFDAETRGSTLRTIEITESEIEYDVVTSSLLSGGFSATVEVQDQENGDLLQSLDVYLGYSDNTSDKGNSTIGDAEVLVQSFSLSDGTIGEFGLPRFTYTTTAAEMQSALGLTGDEIFGGDAFTIRFEIVRTDGAVYSAADNSGTITGSYFSSPFEYSSVLVCAPKPTQAGTWTIDMQDSYGDGWQPTTADGGGPGIIITLSDGTVFEIGLCTPYEDPGYDCTDGTSEGTATFDVPAGQTAEASIEFQGDFWGEMSFQIYTPEGNLVASVGSGTAAGPVAIDYCAD
ncbi:hypothetical protein GCM10011414_26960 [Croceivirga lutea]|uniref:hypothetical protein n=1 Tax=Croceivirga lutea TaxID=1775167 RepID=UPI00163953D2|nr:hypothetical protein [Croceivirga lutea]GGG55704.1 hypothetical protein GCM10011414_26960 [Croceivirga lutea]